MEKTDIETIEEELSNFEDLNTYISNLRNKILSIKDNILKIKLLNKICSQQLKLITKNLNEQDKQYIFSEFKFLWEEIVNEIKKDKIIPEDYKKNLLIYIKWLPYIINYKTSLKDIKMLLKKCKDLISYNFNKWKSIANLSESNLTSLIYEIKNCESQEKISICAILRRIIETIFTLQILNNKKSIKNEFKYEGFYSYCEFLYKEKIKWRIRTLYIKECHDNKYKYAISGIWKNKELLNKKIHKELLSANIHQQFENLISPNFLYLDEESKNIINYVNKKLNELSDLERLTDELTLILKDHLISFEKNELTIVIRDFEIDEFDLNEKYFRFGKKCILKEILNSKNEKLIDLFKSIDEKKLQ